MLEDESTSDLNPVVRTNLLIYLLTPEQPTSFSQVLVLVGDRQLGQHT